MGVNNKKRRCVLQKLLIFIISIIVIAVVTTVIAVNVVFEQNKHESFMQKIPFTRSLFFCPTAQAVSNRAVEAGSIIIVHKRTSYEVGDLVMVHNTGTVFEPVSPLLIGVVNSNNGGRIEVNVGEENSLNVMVAPDLVYGTMEYNIGYIGYLYKSMLGLRGFIIFGFLPLLIGVVFIIMLVKTMPPRAKVHAVNFDSDEIEVLAVEVIRTVAPDEVNTKGGVSVEERPRGIIETVQKINDTTTLIIRKEGYLDEVEEDVIDSQIQKSSQQIDEIAQKASELDFGDVHVSQSKATLHIEETDKVVPSMVAAAVAASEQMENADKTSEQAKPAMTYEDMVANATVQMENVDKIAEPVMTYEDMSASIVVDTNVGAVANEPVVERKLPSKLSASEIVKLYRLSKQSDEQRKNVSEEELFTMAKLYYDDDIESYSSK